MPVSTANAHANLNRLVSPVQVRQWLVKPLDDGSGGTEVSTVGTGYSRLTQAIGSPASRERESTAAIVYTALLDWGIVEAFSWHESDAGEFYAADYYRASLHPVPVNANPDNDTFDSLDLSFVVTSVDAAANTFTKNSHGLWNGRIVLVSSSGTLPGGLTVDTKYYVVGRTANSFQVSATVGGTAIDLTSAGSGQITIETTHGFANGDRISLHAAGDGIIPGGTSENRRYFVVNATATTFQISLTSGGAAIDLTSEGGGLIMAWYIQTFNIVATTVFEFTLGELIFEN